jgi:hypothetical protein
MSNLTTPLLASDDSDHVGNRDQAAHTPSSSLPLPLPSPPPPPPLSKTVSWWRKLLLQLTHLYEELLDFFYWHLWPSSRHLSLTQTTKLQQLQQRAAVVYDPKNVPEHEQHLRRLWKVAFPGINCPPGDDIKSAQWKVMGWQGEDPASDFRGGGFLSLELLTYFGEREPEIFESLMKKTNGNRSEWEYPFAAAGVNITYMLTEILELKNTNTNNKQSSSRAVVGFLKLLETDEYVLETLFIESFVLLDNVWLEQQASYMEFNQCLREVKERVTTTLSRRWLKSLTDLKSIHY